MDEVIVASTILSYNVNCIVFRSCEFTLLSEAICVACLCLIIFSILKKMKVIEPKVNESLLFRPHTGQGLWCALILPQIYSSSPGDVSPGDGLQLLILFYSIITALDYEFGNYIGKRVLAVMYTVHTIAFVTVSCHMWSTDNIGLGIVVFVGRMYWLLRDLPRWFPGCFSLGETLIICQALIIFLTRSTRDAINLLKAREGDPVEHLSASVLLHCVQIYVMILLIVMPCCRLSLGSCKTSKILATVGLTCGILIYAGWWTLLSWHSIVLLLTQLLAHKWRRYLGMITYWVILSLVAIVLVAFFNSGGRRVTTTKRKYFHLVITAVFVAGLLWEPALLKVASIFIFLLFMDTEVERYCKLPPLGQYIDDKLRVFLDERDSVLILTPMYLLVGCSLPLWLQTSLGPDIALYSGVISVGIGDTAASVVGYTVGKYHWPASKKTLEGTIAAFISMSISLYCLVYLGHTPELSVLQICTLAGLTALLEAATTQIDNLVLPLFLYALVRMC